jgi:hypothetical protein
MTSMKVLSRDDIHEGSAPLVPLKEWELVELPDPDLEYVGLVFRPEWSERDGGHAPRIYRCERRTLLDMARTVLREIEPTPEQEILATLRRIERLLEK